MEAIDTKENAVDEGVVRVELVYSPSELHELIAQLPSRHPLVSHLKEQLRESVSKQKGELSSRRSSLTYLSKKLHASSMEQLLSKALSFVNWGIELEERGFTVQAVKQNIFTKEVITFRIGGN